MGEKRYFYLVLCSAQIILFHSLGVRRLSTYGAIMWVSTPCFLYVPCVWATCVACRAASRRPTLRVSDLALNLGGARQHMNYPHTHTNSSASLSLGQVLSRGRRAWRISKLWTGARVNKLSALCTCSENKGIFLFAFCPRPCHQFIYIYGRVTFTFS